MSYLPKTLTMQDWFSRVYQKSRSESSVKVAKAAINAFEAFCIHEYNKKPDTIINELRKSNDNRKYILLNNWISYLDESHPQHKQRKRDPSTIRAYFSFLKSYFRSQGIKLNSDDVKDFVQFPTKIKQLRKPLERETIKLILENSTVKRRALYLTLISSGMRVGEALALRKRDFDFTKDPVAIIIPGRFTKTRQTRETFISKEAKKYVERIIKKKKESDRVFTDLENLREAVDNEGEVFDYLRKKHGLTERYEESIRHVVVIHGFRSFFHTKAAQKHGDSYAHALDGHGAYLATYYRLSSEEKAKMYKELEPELTIDDSERLRIQNQKLEKEKSELENQLPKLVDEAVERIKDQLRKEGAIVDPKQ